LDGFFWQLNLNEYANIFNYATGQAPTLAAFEAQIGFPLINGAKFGDTIVFDNVGYVLGEGVFEGSGLTGLLKCSATLIGDYAFKINQITYLYLPLCESIAEVGFGENPLAFVYLPLCESVGYACFIEISLQYFNAPIIQQFGGTTGNNGVFADITGNTITVIVPSIHQTSNGGGLEGDLAYLDANNTVTFDWDGDEVPDWINQTANAFQLDVFESMILPVAYEDFAAQGWDENGLLYAVEFSIVRVDPVYGSETVKRRFVFQENVSLDFKELIFINSYGIPESMALLGYSDFNLQSNKQILQRTPRHDFSTVKGMLYQFNNDSSNAFTVRTGHVPKQEAETMQSALISAATFIKEKGNMVPVVVEPGSFQIIDTSEILAQIEFSLNKGYALNNYSKQELLPQIEISTTAGVFVAKVAHTKPVQFPDEVEMNLKFDSLETDIPLVNGAFTASNFLNQNGRYRAQVNVIFNEQITTLTKSFVYQKQSAGFRTPLMPAPGAGSLVIAAHFQIEVYSNLTVFIDSQNGIGQQTINVTLSGIVYLEAATGAGYRFVEIQSHDLSKIRVFRNEGYAYFEPKLLEMSDLQVMELVNMPIGGHFYAHHWNKLTYLDLTNCQLTGLTLGLPRSIQYVFLNQNLLTSKAIEQFLEEMWLVKDAFLNPMFIVITDNPGSANPTIKSTQIINGTGPYLDNGLLQKSIFVIL
jgi:hypothetical protein